MSRSGDAMIDFLVAQAEWGAADLNATQRDELLEAEWEQWEQMNDECGSLDYPA
ncbi:MAG: hypothetical protein NW237_12465 [Cyanobacteriota bacterium]|nr:hypothetical protein [Cyanobacteriota bacterium]